MSPDSARLVILIAAAAGGLVWLISVAIAARLLRRKYDPYNPEASDYDVSGTTRVNGKPAALAETITERLVSSSTGFMGTQCKILKSTPEQIRFQLGVSASDSDGYRRPGLSSCEIELRLRDIGETTEVAYLIDIGHLRRKMALIALGINVLGLAAVTVLPAALYIYVAPHPDPAVRWQAVQVCQMVHLLWPPFLMLGLYQRTKRLAANAVETLIANLQYGK